MGKEDVGNTDLEFLEAIGHGRRPDGILDSAQLGISSECRRASKQVLDLYPSLIEVDPEDLIKGLNPEDVSMLLMSTEALALSTFCTGGCVECAAGAKPYSPRNKTIFAVDPLIKFMKKHHFSGGISGIRTYDDSDPLDYPYILKLLSWLDNHSGASEVKVLTSCPPGREEIFKILFKTKFKNVKVGLSVLPSNRDRLTRNGILDIAAQTPLRVFGTHGFKHIVDDRPIGRNRAPGSLATGFSSGDSTILHPSHGFCSHEYHIASDFAPNEGVLKPVKESGRIYARNPFFAFQPMDMFGTSAKTYMPFSSYYKLGTHEYISEVSLRHIAAHVYSVYEAVAQSKRYSPVFEEGLNIMKNSFGVKAKNGGHPSFQLPEDSKERSFYRDLIFKLMDGLRAVIDQYDENFCNGVIVMDNFNHGGAYAQLVERLDQVLRENHDAIFIGVYLR